MIPKKNLAARGSSLFSQVKSAINTVTGDEFFATHADDTLGICCLLPMFDLDSQAQPPVDGHAVSGLRLFTAAKIEIMVF